MHLHAGDLFLSPRFPSVHKPLLVTVPLSTYVLGAPHLLKHVSAALHVLGAVRLLVHVGDDEIIWGPCGLDIVVLDSFPLSPHVNIFNT